MGISRPYGTVSNRSRIGISTVPGGVSTSNSTFNFTAGGALDSRITFTRASAAWHWNSAGANTQVATNIARANANQDYNPTTLAPRGFLIEEARTNLLLNSTTLATQDVTVTAVQHTLSFYGTGTITLSGASTAGPLVGTGATNLVQLTFTPSAGTLTCTVTGTVTLANLSIGAFATSRIVTAGTQVTRAVDNATITSLPSIGWNAAQGTIYVEFMLEGVGGANTPRVLAINDGTATNEMRLLVEDGAADLIRFIVVVGGVTQANVNTTVAASALTLYKTAISWNTNSFRAVVNGTAGTEDTSGTLPTVSQINIGRELTTQYLNGWIPTLSYYPYQMTNAQMIALTS